MPADSHSVRAYSSPSAAFSCDGPRTRTRPLGSLGPCPAALSHGMKRFALDAKRPIVLRRTKPESRRLRPICVCAHRPNDLSDLNDTESLVLMAARGAGYASARAVVAHSERGMERASKMCKHSPRLRGPHNSASDCWAEEMYWIQCIN